jgi:hypothetical protein
MENFSFEVEVLKEVIIWYFWNTFEVGLDASEEDFQYDISVLRKKLIGRFREEQVAAILLFVNMLRFHIIKLNKEGIINTLVSFEHEAKMLRAAFEQDNYQDN